MTGQETFIHQELLKNTIRFYPIKKSLVIEGRNKEKKDLPSLFMKLDKLDKKVDETLEQI